jgi:glycosyltransferase involved in cell wall biosynthesis
MKVIVSHIGKQHVNALLLGLTKHHALTKFYTSIAANKFTPTLASFLAMTIGKNWVEKIKKQQYQGISDDKIVHFPLIAFFKKIIKSEYWGLKTSHKWFDKWVASIIKTADFDILIGYENSNLWSFKVAKKRGKITVLDFTAVHHGFQNPVLTDASVYSNSREVAYISNQKEEALRYTDYIIALSSFAEKTLIDNGFPQNRIYKTYLGINQTVFTPKTTYNFNKNGERSLRGIEATEGPLELYFVGTLSYRKGLPFMMQLLNTLIERKFNVRLTLIGPVDDFDVPQLNAPYFRYIPFLNHAELVKIHHELDVFIFPSNIDSWAQVVIEAMACGSPILVSENTGAKDAVAQGGGVVLPVGDLTAWVNAVEHFYNNRFLLKKVGEQAALVSKQYTWEAYHEQVFDIMSDIYQRENTSILQLSLNV